MFLIIMFAENVKLKDGIALLVNQNQRGVEYV